MNFNFTLNPYSWEKDDTVLFFKQKVLLVAWKQPFKFIVTLQYCFFQLTIYVMLKLVKAFSKTCIIRARFTPSCIFNTNYTKLVSCWFASAINFILPTLLCPAEINTVETNKNLLHRVKAWGLNICRLIGKWNWNSFFLANL